MLSVINIHNKYILKHNLDKWLKNTKQINPLCKQEKYNKILSYLKSILIRKNIYNLNKYNRFIIHKNCNEIIKYVHKKHPEKTVENFTEDYIQFV